MLFFQLFLYTFNTHAQESRVTLNMNADWAFFRGEVEGGEEVAINDSSWIATTLPHVMQLEKKHCGGSLMEREEHHVGVVNKLLERITELEASTLTVKLPKPHAHLILIQAGYPPDDYWDDVAISHSEKDRCCDGS